MGKNHDSLVMRFVTGMALGAVSLTAGCSSVKNSSDYVPITVEHQNIRTDGLGMFLALGPKLDRSTTDMCIAVPEPIVGLQPFCGSEEVLRADIPSLQGSTFTDVFTFPRSAIISICIRDGTRVRFIQQTYDAKASFNQQQTSLSAQLINDELHVVDVTKMPGMAETVNGIPCKQVYAATNAFARTAFPKETFDLSARSASQ